MSAATFFRSVGYRWRVEDAAGPVQGGVHVGVVEDVLVGVVEHLVGAVPAAVAAGGQRFADSGRAVAESDGGVAFDGVGELDEASVLFGRDESLAHVLSSR